MEKENPEKDKPKEENKNKEEIKQDEIELDSPINLNPIIFNQEELMKSSSKEEIKTPQDIP